MTIRVFGDSHVAALRTGAEGSEFVASSGIEIDFYGRHGLNFLQFEILEFDGKIRIRRDPLPGKKPLDYLIDSPDDLYVFSSILHSARSYSNAAWKTFCPWQCAAANPDLHSVSSAVLRTWIQAEVQCRYDLLIKLKDHGYNVAVVEPPKPLRRVPGRHGIRPDVLLAVDQFHRRLVTRMLRDAGVEVISVPDHTHADGFTVAAYESSDPRDVHHGNERFGVEMMDRVVQHALVSSPVIQVS